jgi:hypothetical protein
MAFRSRTTEAMESETRWMPAGAGMTEIGASCPSVSRNGPCPGPPGLTEEQGTTDDALKGRLHTSPWHRPGVPAEKRKIFEPCKGGPFRLASFDLDRSRKFRSGPVDAAGVTKVGGFVSLCSERTIRASTELVGFEILEKRLKHGIQNTV